MDLNNYLARNLVTFANVAALPTPGNAESILKVLDDGTGAAALAIWDPAAAAYTLIRAGAGGGPDWQESVLDKDLNTPPVVVVGARYIVAAGGVGAWAGHDDDIAQGNTSAGWDFTTPNEGTTCEVEDEDQYYTFNGVAWVNSANFLLHGSLSGLGNDDHTQYHNNTRGDIRYWKITVAATPPGSPSDGDLWHWTTQDMLMFYDAGRSKWLSVETIPLSFGRIGNTAAGSLFNVEGVVGSGNKGYYIPFNATVVGLTINRRNTLATTIIVQEDGVSVTSHATSALKTKDMTLNDDIAIDKTLSFKNQTGGNIVVNLNGLCLLRWRFV